MTFYHVSLNNSVLGCDFHSNDASKCLAVIPLRGYQWSHSRSLPQICIPSFMKLSHRVHKFVATRGAWVKIVEFIVHMLYRHVVLGFSHRGDCIISYMCYSQFQELKYWLYWWHFNINKQLVLVSLI